MKFFVSVWFLKYVNFCFINELQLLISRPCFGGSFLSVFLRALLKNRFGHLSQRVLRCVQYFSVSFFPSPRKLSLLSFSSILAAEIDFNLSGFLNLSKAAQILFHFGTLGPNWSRLIGGKIKALSAPGWGVNVFTHFLIIIADYKY